MTDVTLKLSDIGLGFNIDENVGNYTKDETGNMHYLESFSPWQADATSPGGLEVLFNEETLRTAIDGIPDQETKKECVKHLGRLMELLAEEQREQQRVQEEHKMGLMECGPQVKELETILAPFLMEDALVMLHAIKTEEEAEKSNERKSAEIALTITRNRLAILKNKTNISNEEYITLCQKYEILSRAVGMVNRGVIDRSR